MVKKVIGIGAAGVLALSAQLAAAADLNAQDISHVSIGCGMFADHPDWCIKFPAGTVDLNVTPHMGERPESASDVYVIAVHEGKFYSYNTGTTDPALRWRQVPSNELPGSVTFSRAPFDGLVMNRQIYLGDHVRLKGTQIFAGAAGKGRGISLAELKKIWTND